MEETIFALASGAGRAGIAVFRISGPRAGQVLTMLCGRIPPAPRRATRVRVKAAGDLIDEGLALWFPSPASFTGEDVVELHLHGGPAVASALCEALVSLGLRPAEPGEFTRRAFEAGKLDLTRAEAIADLVAADTSAQRRQALRQMDGELARLYDGWRERLLAAQARIEAEIDFSDEDLPEGMSATARADLSDLAEEFRAHLDDGGRGERLRDGFWVALLGAVNVGKSSLLNRLAGRPAAIVADSAGTTRDVVEVRLDIGGFPITLADTAGLRQSDEAVEQEGIRRAREWGERADLRLVVLDAASTREVDAECRGLLERGDAVLVANKVDLVKTPVPKRIAGHEVWPVSARTGEGIEALRSELARRMANESGESALPRLTRARHRLAVEEARVCLTRALIAPYPELAAEDVRMASRALGRITGRVDVEDMLDVIFREFCIGK